MSSSDILMIVGCLVIGYGLVSMLLRKPGPPPTARRPPASAVDDATPLPLQQRAPPHWSSVLEIPRDATVDQIRDAYRRLISQYHPDKVAALGRELRELAEAKSKDIGIAYQEALMERRTAL
jgi:DnaJ like chaperone protein